MGKGSLRATPNHVPSLPPEMLLPPWPWGFCGVGPDVLRWSRSTCPPSVAFQAILALN